MQSKPECSSSWKKTWKVAHPGHHGHIVTMLMLKADKDFKAFRSLEKSLVFYANQGTKPANTPKLWSRGELKLVGKLLRKMFVYKAENRAKAEDLLGDEWLVAEKCNDKKSM